MIMNFGAAAELKLMDYFFPFKKLKLYSFHLFRVKAIKHYFIQAN